MTPPYHCKQEERHRKAEAIDEEQERPRADGRRIPRIEEDGGKHGARTRCPAEGKAAAEQERTPDAGKAALLERAILTQEQRDLDPSRHEEPHGDDENGRPLPHNVLIGEKPRANE